MRLLFVVVFILLFAAACEKASTDTSRDARPVEDVAKGVTPDAHRVQQGTVLNLDTLRIGIINVESDAAWLSIVSGDAPEERIMLGVGEEIARGAYRIRNLETYEDKSVGVWTPPGGDKSYVRLQVVPSEEDLGMMLTQLAHTGKTLDEASILAVTRQVGAADAVLGIRKMEVMTGARKDLGINERGEWPVGIDGRNGRLMKVIYYCEDVCPLNGNLVLIYENATPDDCATLQGIRAVSMYGDFIACKVSLQDVATAFVPQGDEIRDERSPDEACEPLLEKEQYSGCRLAGAERIDATFPQAFERCSGGGSVAGCFACTFDCGPRES